MENDSFKAQVSAVFFDMNGQIHSRWCRFKNGLGELITGASPTAPRDKPVHAPIHRALLRSTNLYHRQRPF